MADEVQKPDGSGSAPRGRGKAGPLGFGGGPVIAAGVMAGGAVLFAGVGIAQMATADDGFLGALRGDGPVAAAPEDPGASAPTGSTEGTEPAPSAEPSEAPVEDPTTDPAPEDEGTVTLPDADGDGVPDGYEKKSEDPEGPAPESGRGDEDREDPRDDYWPEGSDTGETVVYTIEWGDTLSEISYESGVPIDVLVEVNGIQNPDLIYAGASLLIPPTS